MGLCSKVPDQLGPIGWPGPLFKIVELPNHAHFAQGIFLFTEVISGQPMSKIPWSFHFY